MVEQWFVDRIKKEERILTKANTKREHPIVSRHKVINIAAKQLKNLLNNSDYLLRKGKANAYDIQIVEKELRFPNLPLAFDGISILQLTDLHIDGMPGIEDIIINRISSLNCDLVLLTGDYIEGMLTECDHTLTAYKAILSHVNPRFGIFGTLGNHDSANCILKLETTGINFLCNESVTLGSEGKYISLTGLDDVHIFRSRHTNIAIDSLSQNDFNILAVHSPEAHHLLNKVADLYLTGHTHGGQIGLPFGMHFYKPLNKVCPANMISGLWRSGRTVGYTSHGTGTSIAPVRFLNYAEVTKFTLHRGVNQTPR